MKILAIGCLHGKVPHGLKQFCEKNKVSAILCCGDLAEESEIRDFQFQNWGKIGAHIAKGLSYQSLVNKLLGKSRQKEMQNKARARGMHVMQELANVGIPVYRVSGNHDETLGKKSMKNVKYSNEKIIKFGKIKILGWSFYVGAASKPHLVKRGEVSKVRWDKIALKARKLREKTFQLVAVAKPDIILTHDPPYDTEFDLVDNPKSPMHGTHVGDAIMYEVIKDFRPKLVLCSHMHEHWGKTKLDKTTVVCTGYGHDGKAAVVDLPSLRIKLVEVS